MSSIADALARRGEQEVSRSYLRAFGSRRGLAKTEF
jgi:hypothetical protein